MEAEACHSLGVAQHALGDHAAAVRHHRAELELAHRLGLTHLQVRLFGGRKNRVKTPPAQDEGSVRHQLTKNLVLFLQWPVASVVERLNDSRNPRIAGTVQSLSGLSVTASSYR